MCYKPCVHETITIRPKRPKAELIRAADGNLNRWFNDLIEEKLGPRPVDWNSHFNRPRRPDRTYRHEAVDKIRKLTR